MSSDIDQPAQLVNGVSQDQRHGTTPAPATPLDDDVLDPMSQQAMPSTEAPNSPVDPNSSFKTELNDDRDATVIPSSLTPPPSSQIPQHGGGAAVRPANYAQPSEVLSPPATILPYAVKRDGSGVAELTAPSRQQIADAPREELQRMLLAYIAENSQLKVDAAHYKLQYNLLSLRAEEDSKRAVVEHEMSRKEVEALRTAEYSRQARRELNATSDLQAKYFQMKTCYEQVLLQNSTLKEKLRGAKRLIQQKQDELASLEDNKQMLLTRVRENREHMKIYCSPGGLLHGAVPKAVQAASTPAYHRETPRHAPRTVNGEVHPAHSNLNALLEAAAIDRQDSTPSTPIPGLRSAPRMPSKHSRNAQSMSSLPTTPIARPRYDNTGLLPSVDLVPQTEPPYRNSRFTVDTPTPAKASRERRNSRESTISAEDAGDRAKLSAEDNQELARQAMRQAEASFASLGSANSQAEWQNSHRSPSSRRRQEEEEEVYESQASQAASEMLRRDPRESFEVASSAGVSRDGTPVPAEKSAKLQAKIFGNLNKIASLGHSDKRKFSGSSENLADTQTSPIKKLRVAGGLRDPGRGIASVLAKAPTDIVILSSLRTPITRSYKGGLKDAYPEELLSVVLRATLDATPELDPSKIDDVAVGVVLSELGGSKAARMAMNHVGFNPSTTSLHTTNRACASSLQSITAVASQIRSEMIDVGIGAGMESMTRNYGSKAIPVDAWPALRESPVKDARDCVVPMGMTSENVAARYSVSRADQDAFAVESHLRAARARESGHFRSEIVPVTTRFQEVDKQGAKVGEEQAITVTQDDGIRPTASIEGMARLKPAFKADGASTAGNSSQVSDGAAATLLMRRSTATALGLQDKIMGKFVASSVVGCKPDEMGIGPALAIPKLLTQLGLESKDVQRWEINEAFASQAIHCVRKLGLEKDWQDGRVNPDGGAIALGHPLGATGARMVSTLMHGMKRDGGEVGVVSMCIGTGMGMAGLFVRE
ncbi:peroxisomal 3-ketoacyl-CoA thiolase 2 [Diplogelasinospora grovesii]|uniref:acetyl-CoA C-acyltransferase n=1 Tax=Diplogelasinospora grovesii TaxID=303347 RepID=A0AAN6NBF6_9PEZI|nr:peroxisomal 3-ketoacyl-CoA thiolase 2 [Diplogelasinospora grovesii]